jgi:multiple sugar transport system permease protein
MPPLIIEVMMAHIQNGHWRRIQRWGYFFVAPFVVVFCVFNLWPTLYTFILSFTDLRGLSIDLHITGLSNFKRLLGDKNFLGAIKNTFIISGCTFVPQIGVALLLAIWLSDTRLNLIGRGAFRAVIFMPHLLTMASIAVLFQNFFSYPSGPLTKFFYQIGIRQTLTGETGEIITRAFDFFRSVPFSRGLTSFIYWWMFYGSTNVILMAGITSINPALYESALVDGANSRQTTWYITLPLLRPIILYVFFTTMIGGMQAFDIPFLLTSAGPASQGGGAGGPNNSLRTMALYVYQIGFTGNNDKAYAAAISIGMFALTLGLALIIFFFLQDREDLKKSKT